MENNNSEIDNNENEESGIEDFFKFAIIIGSVTLLLIFLESVEFINPKYSGYWGEFFVILIFVIMAYIAKRKQSKKDELEGKNSENKFKWNRDDYWD